MIKKTKLFCDDVFSSDKYLELPRSRLETLMSHVAFAGCSLSSISEVQIRTVSFVAAKLILSLHVKLSQQSVRWQL